MIERRWDIASETPTRVTLTGTGIPPASAGRAGAGTLVQHGGTAVQFDAGRGTVLRLAEAGTGPQSLSALFLTHHHSDHCIDVADVLLSRWIAHAPALTVIAPDGPLTVFGRNVLELWRDDIHVRRAVTGRPPLTVDWTPFPATGEPGLVWQNGEVRVSSVLVEHPPVRPAVAYKIETPTAHIVISGDTRVCDGVERLARGADLLVHEVALRDAMPDGADDSVYAYHADAVALGGLARRAGVKALMLTHLLPAPTTPGAEARFTHRVRDGGYTGRVIVGRDLMRYTVATRETEHASGAAPESPPS